MGCYRAKHRLTARVMRVFCPKVFQNLAERDPIEYVEYPDNTEP